MYLRSFYYKRSKTCEQVRQDCASPDLAIQVYLSTSIYICTFIEGTGSTTARSRAHIDRERVHILVLKYRYIYSCILVQVYISRHATTVYFLHVHVLTCTRNPTSVSFKQLPRVQIERFLGLFGRRVVLAQGSQVYTIGLCATTDKQKLKPPRMSGQGVTDGIKKTSGSHSPHPNKTYLSKGGLSFVLLPHPHVLNACRSARASTQTYPWISPTCWHRLRIVVCQRNSASAAGSLRGFRCGVEGKGGAGGNRHRYE